MDEQKKRCKACKEFIWADATKCPQCQSPQNKQLRKTILSSLKELSAITVIFSLIFAVMELNRFADAWFENSAYVSRLAVSASMLMDAGEYAGARKLLVDAKKISPTSDDVSILQMQLAVNTIRKSDYPQNAADAQVIINSLEVLYHNLGRSSESDVVAFTHIARASDLLYRNGYAEVDYNLYLDKALALDESYVYANAYKGLWYLDEEKTSPLKKPLTDAELTQKAQYHFNVALQQNTDSNYIRELQLSILKYNPSQASAAEYVKLIFSMHANKDEYFLNNQQQILSDLFQKFYLDIGKFATNKDANIKNVYLSLSEQNINTLEKLIKSDSDYAIKNATLIILSAIINQHKGDNLTAIERFIKASNIVEKTLSGFRYSVPTLLKKVCGGSENLDSKSIARCDDFFASRASSK